MKIHLRDADRRPLGSIEVDPDRRPVRATVAESGREVFLQWDSAIDDGGHLRRCVACGGTDLFHEKAFPVITSVIVVLAFVGAAVSLLGFADRPLVLGILSAVLVADVAILTLSRRHLVCYRCHSSYPGTPVARYHRSWDRAMAERYPRPRSRPAAPGAPAAPTAAPGDPPQIEAVRSGSAGSSVGPVAAVGVGRGS